jgi:hypothetical protein
MFRYAEGLQWVMQYYYSGSVTVVTVMHKGGAGCCPRSLYNLARNGVMITENIAD